MRVSFDERYEQTVCSSIREILRLLYIIIVRRYPPLAEAEASEKKSACLRLPSTRWWCNVIHGCKISSILIRIPHIRASRDERRLADAATRSEIRVWSPRRSIIQSYIASRRACLPDDARVSINEPGKCDSKEEEEEGIGWTARSERKGEEMEPGLVTSLEPDKIFLVARHAESLENIHQTNYTCPKSIRRRVDVYGRDISRRGTRFLS